MEHVDRRLVLRRGVCGTYVASMVASGGVFILVLTATVFTLPRNDSAHTLTINASLSLIANPEHAVTIRSLCQAPVVHTGGGCSALSGETEYDQRNAHHHGMAWADLVAALWAMVSFVFAAYWCCTEERNDDTAAGNQRWYLTMMIVMIITTAPLPFLYHDQPSEALCAPLYKTRGIYNEDVRLSACLIPLPSAHNVSVAQSVWLRGVASHTGNGGFVALYAQNAGPFAVGDLFVGYTVDPTSPHNDCARGAKVQNGVATAALLWVLITNAFWATWMVQLKKRVMEEQQQQQHARPVTPMTITVMPLPAAA